MRDPRPVLYLHRHDSTIEGRPRAPGSAGPSPAWRIGISADRPASRADVPGTAGRSCLGRLGRARTWRARSYLLYRDADGESVRPCSTGTAAGHLSSRSDRHDRRRRIACRLLPIPRSARQIGAFSLQAGSSSRTGIIATKRRSPIGISARPPGYRSGCPLGLRAGPAGRRRRSRGHRACPTHHVLIDDRACPTLILPRDSAMAF